MCIMYADGDVQRLADGLGVGLQVDMEVPKNWWLILYYLCNWVER